MGRVVDEMTLRDARELLGVSSASTPAEVRQAPVNRFVAEFLDIPWTEKSEPAPAHV